MFHFNLPLPAIAAGMDFKVFKIFVNAAKMLINLVLNKNDFKF
jgi:hypothetical protein